MAFFNETMEDLMQPPLTSCGLASSPVDLPDRTGNPKPLAVLVMTKRQYMQKDLLQDRFGRFREIPLALAEKGHAVQGLCLSYRRQPQGLFFDGPVRWTSINATRSKIPGLARFIREAIRQARSADAIWACSDSFYGIIGYFVGGLFGIPVVFDLYDNFDYYLMAKLPIIKQLYRLALLKCDAVTCASNPLAQLITSFGRKKKTSVLENAIRRDLFRPRKPSQARARLGLPTNARIIGTAGALTANRGIHHLFAAFAELRDKHPDLHLAVAGPRDNTFHLPRHNRIHDFGVLALEEVGWLLSALDVAVICNEDNAFGRYCFPQKAREIMACNVPLVAAHVASMAELFSHRPEWLYRTGDSRDLARVIEARFVRSETNYTGIISWQQAADRLEAVLMSVCKGRHDG